MSKDDMWPEQIDITDYTVNQIIATDPEASLYYYEYRWYRNPIKRYKQIQKLKDLLTTCNCGLDCECQQ